MILTAAAAFYPKAKVSGGARAVTRGFDVTKHDPRYPEVADPEFVFVVVEVESLVRRKTTIEFGVLQPGRDLCWQIKSWRYLGILQIRPNRMRALITGRQYSNQVT